MEVQLFRSTLSEPTVTYEGGSMRAHHPSARRHATLLAIHDRALRRAQSFRSSEVDMIESLREVEDAKVFLHFELTSLYQYAIQILKLSEDVACSLIAIMRKSRAVPELTEKIRDGSITASKARKVASVITPANKDAWLELAATESSRVIEKAVATENPKAAVQEMIRYKTAERLEFTIGVSEEWLSLLKNIKDLLSQEHRRAVSSEEALEFAMKELRERSDPLCRAERALSRAATRAKQPSEDVPVFHQTGDGGDVRSADGAVDAEANLAAEQRCPTFDVVTSRRPGHASSSVPGRIRSSSRTRLPASVKNAVTLRDGRRCRHTYTDGKRCEQRRWLDVHHVIPVSRGGSNEVANLITLCSAHHKLLHR